MSLTVVAGRANSGKTGEVYASIRHALSDGRSATLLLPSQPDVFRARDEFARDCAIGLRISGFRAYLEGLWRLYGDGRGLVGAEQRLALIVRALRAGDLDQWPGLRLEGIARAVASAARDYPSCTARGGGSADADIRTKLVRILSEYSGTLSSADLVEPVEAFALLGREAPAPRGPTVCHRFTDLTAWQEEFLTRQADSGAEVIVTLPWEAGFAPTSSVEGLVRRLTARGELKELAQAGTFTCSKELRRVERRLFAGGPAEPASGDVRLVLGVGDEGEAEGIVAEVSRLLADGIPAEQVAIVFRDPLPHLPWLLRALREARIDHDLDLCVPVRRTPLGSGTLSLLRFFTKGRSRDDMVGFLRSPCSGVRDARAVDAAEESWRGRRVTEGQALLREAKECGRRTRAALRIAGQLSGAPVAAAALPEWQSLLDTLFGSAHPEGLSGDRESLRIDSAVHRATLGAVEQLACLDRPSEAADVVSAIEGLTLGTAVVERTGCVQVLEAERARSRRFSAVIVGGLTATEFPRPGEADRRESGGVATVATLLGLASGRRVEGDGERLLFYQLVTRARQVLVLSRRVADPDGHPVRESVFWDEFLDLYRDPAGPHEDDVGGLPVRRVSASIPSPGSPPTSRREGDLEDSEVRDALAAREVFSASEIESYLRCPYRWFFERELRPQKLDPELDARQAGIVAHEALRLFYAGLHEVTGESRVTPDALDRVRELLDSSFRAAARATEPHELAEEERLRKAQRSVRELVRRDADFLPGWEPIALEWSFGRDDDPEQFDGFALTGMVDRIDRGPAGLVVMDYKCSAEVPTRKRFADGVVQIPLYAEVVRRRFGEDVVAGLYRSLRRTRNAERGFYLAGMVDDPALTTTDACAGREMFDGEIAAAHARAALAVDGIRSGRIPKEPRDPRECVTCAARHGCTVGQR